MKEISNEKNCGGFSLMEIIVSIGIISVGIVSLINLFSYILKSEFQSRDKMIALYLAEENMEVMRQLRDNNWFTSVPWNIGFDADGNKVIVFKNCTDITAGFEAQDDTPSRRIIYRDDTNNYYGQCADLSYPALDWKETSFRRWLTIAFVDFNGNPYAGGNDKYMKITSNVSYNGGAIQLIAYLANWR